MAGEAEVSAMAKTSETAMRLLLEIMRMLRENGRQTSAAMRTAKQNASNKPTDKPLVAGRVAQSELLTDAHKCNYSVKARDGITKADMARLAAKAKDYGISVAFTNKKEHNNIKVSYRESDEAVFGQIMTDVIKERLAEKPNEYGAFSVEKANLPHFQKMLDGHDLSYDFVADKDGNLRCLYTLADKKAFDIVKAEFQKTHADIAENLKVEKTDEYYTVKYGEREISFEQSEVPTATVLTERFKNELGLSDIAAGLAVAKTADELPPALREKMLADDPLKSVNNFEQNIRLKNESVLCQPYELYRVGLKDGTDAFVYMNENGQTATLIPEFMTETKIRETLTTRLSITDEKTLAALADKADRVNDIYARDLSHKYVGDFVVTKDRAGNFSVKRGEVSKEYVIYDNKGAVKDLQRDFGIDKATAKELLNHAEKQRANSREKDLARAETKLDAPTPVYEIKREIGSKFTVTQGEKTETYSIDGKAETTEKLQRDWNMTSEKAESVYGKAEAQSAFDKAPHVAENNEAAAREASYSDDMPPLPSEAPPEIEIDAPSYSRAR